MCLGGRYDGKAPVAFVDDTLKVARINQLTGTDAIYIGCGSERNFILLVSGGLELSGLDVPGAAIEQLARRLPDRRLCLVHCSLDSLPTWAIVRGSHRTARRSNA